MAHPFPIKNHQPGELHTIPKDLWVYNILPHLTAVELLHLSQASPFIRNECLTMSTVFQVALVPSLGPKAHYKVPRGTPPQNRSSTLRVLDARVTIHRLEASINNQCIYPVSPMRLLRLVNGRLCECCLRVPMHFVPVYGGMLLCKACYETKLRRCGMICVVGYAVSKNQRYKEVIKHNRVAKHRAAPWNSTKMVGFFTKEIDNSDSVGPIVLYEHVREMADSEFSLTDSADVDSYIKKYIPNAPTQDSPRRSGYRYYEEFALMCHKHRNTIEDGKMYSLNKALTGRRSFAW